MITSVLERTVPRSSLSLLEARVVAVGNSRGIRLPKGLLQRYNIGETLILESRPEGILLRVPDGDRLSWVDTYREMAASGERNDEWDATLGDGLSEEPW
jgi:antitoxin MazE